MTGQPDETRSEDEPRAMTKPPCEHLWISTHQPDFPDALYWVRRCSLCGDYDGADLSEQVATLLADRSRLEQENEQLREVVDTVADREASITADIDHYDRLIDAAEADLAAARAEVTRLGRDLDEAEGLLRDWLAWGKAIADALGLNYDTDQERDERMIADAMRMRAAIDEAVRMCNGPGSAQSEASQVKKRVGGVLAAALGGVPEDERRSE